MADSMEMAFIQYNKKTWCKSALLGFFIGLAVIVPGISGSTVAIIFRLYDQFLYALGNLFKRFKACFIFLLPIGIGVVVGVLLGFIAVKELLDFLPFAIVCLFAGLMTGAFPAVYDEVRDAQKTPLRVTLFIVGLCIPVAIGCASALLSTSALQGAQTALFANVQWWHFTLGLLFGAIVSLTQIVPGLSASAFLMAVGWFASIIDSVSFTYWKNNPAIFVVYAGLGIGFVGGLLGFSGVLTKLFQKARHTSYSMIVGLSLGSILSMFCNGDIIEVYYSWGAGTARTPIVDIVLGVVLFVLGCIGAYMLVRYQRKKDKQGQQK